MNKLVIIIANRDIEKKLTQALVKGEYRFTRIGSTGGFLRKKNLTLLLGVDQEKVESLIALVKEIAKEKSALIGSDTGSTLSSESGMPDLPLGAAPIRVGGATVFVLPVDQSVRI